VTNFAAQPLSNIKVVDFSWVGAGSYTTRILADLGADVVKIESSKRIDQIRVTPPFKDGVPGVNRSGYFADRNAGKRSIAVNLKTPEGLELALSLIEDANIVANNFAPGTMDRLGLGYEDVRVRRPDVIYLEMSMQGRDGPNARHVGYGLTIGALAGLQHLVGEDGRPPIGTGTNYPDHIPSPGHAAFAILSALRHWRRTGEGQYIEISQTEATACVLGDAFMAESVGVHQDPQANDEATAIVHDTFRTAVTEEWIAISVYTQDEWRALTHVLGISTAVDANWVTNTAPGSEHAVREWIETGTTRWRAAELMERLQSAGVRAGVVQTARDVVDSDPQLRHRGHWLRLPHPEVGSFLYNALPLRCAQWPVAPRFGAPCLGEHTMQVLSAAGLEPSEIDKLRAAGVLE